MDSENPFLHTHDLLLQLQRKRRFIALSGGVPAEQIGEALNFHEQTILLTLFAEPNKSVKQIISILRLEQSWVSRIVSSLEERGLIKSASDPKDKRSKLLRITRKGREGLEKLDAFLAGVMAKTLKDLSQQEAKELETTLVDFADRIKSPPFPHREHSHPMDVALSRLTVGSGFLSESIFGSGLNNTQIQVFYVLDEHRGENIPVSAVNEFVPYDMSTVSRTLSGFQKRGWIKKERSETDKRSFLIHLSEEGESQLDQYRSLATDFFKPALANQAPVRLGRMNALLEKATSVSRTRTAPDTEEVRSLPPALIGEYFPEASRRTDRYRFAGVFRGETLIAAFALEQTTAGEAIRHIHYLSEEISGQEGLRIAALVLGD